MKFLAASAGKLGFPPLLPRSAPSAAPRTQHKNVKPLSDSLSGYRAGPAALAIGALALPRLVDHISCIGRDHLPPPFV
ncbi:hypothetical protein [Sphingobium sp. ba1]|jgi:hypothetical protein|uniref:hypothetical protein n=1 Tax=Sphingobium sp. ba1 TaxID=1522072 RepID=UPI0012E0818B|nr:hypothetical protein [Sphingobium sp. ba1]